MYEHPYLSEQLTRHDQEQMERAAARRLFLIEHADQIRPRPEGAVRRILRRAFGSARQRSATAPTSAQCDAAAAPAQ